MSAPRTIQHLQRSGIGLPVVSGFGIGLDCLLVWWHVHLTLPPPVVNPRGRDAPAVPRSTADAVDCRMASPRRRGFRPNAFRFVILRYPAHSPPRLARPSRGLREEPKPTAGGALERRDSLRATAPTRPSQRFLVERQLIPVPGMRQVDVVRP